MNIETINQKILEKPTLEFGPIFSASIALFKKVWLLGFIILLLTFVTILMLNDNPKILTILFFSLPRHDTAKAVGEP